ncbi:MAG: hypothetical protein JRD93_21800, partial [Deltaproteobacteria bacterium]|nr:hypothetical protein [Deltaproteobacteria bacterium]
EYLRKKIGVIDRKSDVYLASFGGIRGIVDEVLFLDDDTAAPLDYKFAEYKNKLFKTYRFQLIFYARLIKDNFQVPVKKGFIIYTRSKNKLVEVPLKDKDFIELESAALIAAIEIYAKGLFSILSVIQRWKKYWHGIFTANF